MTNELLRSVGRLARRFRADENGATAIEYAMIAAGVGATIAATVFNMGTQIKTTLWDKIGGAM
jgi:pilus assembly protein Flp/PilA